MEFTGFSLWRALTKLGSHVLTKYGRCFNTPFSSPRLFLSILCDWCYIKRGNLKHHSPRKKTTYVIKITFQCRQGMYMSIAVHTHMFILKCRHRENSAFLDKLSVIFSSQITEWDCWGTDNTTAYRNHSGIYLIKQGNFYQNSYIYNFYMFFAKWYFKFPVVKDLQKPNNSVVPQC